MVKQFTIPCQFGQEMAPVTLYIGHPEATHHPINFQSQWLSSARQGQVPQDLMDTLQKLHDLAIENNADFEELCYYALISATNNSAGNGVSPDDINKYADDFVKKEASGMKPETPTDNSTQTETTDNNNKTQTTNANNNSNVDANGNIITKSSTTTEDIRPETATENKSIQSQATTANENTNNQPTEQQNNNQQQDKQLEGKGNKEQTEEIQEQQKVIPTINTTPAETTTQIATTNNDLTAEEPQSNISQQTKDIVSEAINDTYSQDDEDLLLMDDMEPIDNIINANNNQAQPTDTNNTNIKEAEQTNNNEDNNNASNSSGDSSVYDDEDADLL